MTSSTQDERLGSVLAAERKRQELVIARDFAALAELLDDEVVYIHSMGQVQDKTAYLTHAQGPVRIIDIKRGPLRVCFLGDAALMSGSQTNTFQPPQGGPTSVDSFATQVWRWSGECWRLLSFQATRTAAS